jgi:hypothetical protein
MIGNSPGVTRIGYPPWQPWPASARVPSFGRWDDPYGEFSVVYAALSPEAAIAEVVAPFRRAFGPAASLDPPELVPAGVLEDRILATGRLDVAHVIDLTRHLPEVLVPLGMPADQAVTTPDRRLTQGLARTVYEIGNEAGHRRFDGILSTSGATGAEVVALFRDRVAIDPLIEEPTP